VVSIPNAVIILRQFPGLPPSGSAGILNPFLQIRVYGITVAVGVETNPRDPRGGLHFPAFLFPFPTEATMNAKKRRKVYGVRRETRRPRGWTRWFQEGLFETESSNSIRLRTTLWGQK